MYVVYSIFIFLSDGIECSKFVAYFLLWGVWFYRLYKLCLKNKEKIRAEAVVQW